MADALGGGRRRCRAGDRPALGIDRRRGGDLRQAGAHVLDARGERLVGALEVRKRPRVPGDLLVRVRRPHILIVISFILLIIGLILTKIEFNKAVNKLEFDKIRKLDFSYRFRSKL